jgi:hypothetical protein
MAVWARGSRVSLNGSLVRPMIFVALLTLSACGGGGDGGVGIAGGQGPDPVAVYVPIAYVKRPLPTDDQGLVESSDARELITFDVGADLYLLERASPSAAERNITMDETQGLGDVRDLEVSYDGLRIVFAMRGPFLEGVDEDDQPTWNIWEYDIENNLLRRVIASDITAEAGHDIAPHYLPDGRIMFSSTRQRQSNAVLLDEGKPQFAALDEDFNEHAFVLHVMDEDGGNVRQVSYNQSHEIDATVLSNGQIAFTRWDNAAFNNAMHLYRMDPDGTDLELLYGALSHDSGTNGATIQFLQPREMPDGRMLTIIRPFDSDNLGGDLAIIDTPQYLENIQPNAANIGVLSGPAQETAVVNDVRTDGTISPGGSFSSAFPLWDGTDRVFVSWSECRLVEMGNIVPCTADRLADPAAQPADPLYGIWIYDRSDDTQLPVVPPVEGIMITDVVAAQTRSLPGVLFDEDATGGAYPDLVAEGVGVLNIRSVYDVDGVDVAVPDIPGIADPAVATADERPARFLKLVKAVSIPDDDVLDLDGTAFGVSALNGMREILGYIPIEPDGSVLAKVPANVAFHISVLDRDGRRITPRHNNWLQVRPGQQLSCSGCHDITSGLSHGRTDAFDTVYDGAQNTGQPFPNTDPAIFADFGETMAEARGRISCATDCASITPSVDLIYDDVWTDEVAAGRAADVSFVYSYGDLATPVPTTNQCLSNWSAACRTVINYEMHIHPLWGLPRQILDVDGVTVLADNTCTVCHNTVDDMGVAMVPAGQLDLTDGPSADEPDHLRSYRELLFGDNEQEVVMGALQDRLIQVGVDPDTGDPIFDTVAVGASMSSVGANASPQFFDRFEQGGTHAGYLSDAELRLVSEWLDIGGQYFNNPFDAPIN